MDLTNKTPQFKQKHSISIDLRIITVLLLVVIASMFFLWKPWVATDGERLIEITGESKLTDKPDEFVFMPAYQFKNTNKDTALAELSKKSDQVVAKLKALGVADNKIKTNSGGYDAPVYLQEGTRDATYTLQLTVTTGTELAQKVQDYLLTTSPSGTVSPQATFSDAKRKELESKARDEATKDARTKAEQTAKNLGFKVGKVKAVSDDQGFGIEPYPAAQDRAVTPEDTEAQLNLQPGENELRFSVKVTYFID